MKRILFLSLLFSAGAHADTLSTGDEFVVDGRRRSADVSGSQSLTQDQSASSTETRTTLSRGEGTVRGTAVSGSSENLNNTGDFAVTQSGGLDNANASQRSGNTTQMIGLAMGAGFAAICPTTHGSWACAPAAMSFLDALRSGQASRNAAYTAAQIDPNTGQPYPYETSGIDDVYEQQAIDGLNDLRNAGYQANSDGSVTGPNGLTITKEDLASKESLMKKGFTEAQAAAAMKQLGQVKAAAVQKAKAALGEEGALAQEGAEGGATNGTGGSADGANGGAVYNGTGQAMGDLIVEEVEYRGKADSRMPASEAAELSKNFNGTPIGIGMADLFLIVHKKYSEKKNSKTKEFITGEY